MRNLLLHISLFISTFCFAQNVEEIEDLDNGYYIYKKNSKFGISNNYEKVAYIYDSIYHPRGEKYIMLQKNGKWGAWNLKTKQILPFEYEAIRLTRYRINNLKGEFYVKKNGKLGTVDTKNRIVIPIEYNDISRLNEHNPGVHYVVQNGKTGIISFKGKIIIPIQYDSLYYYSEKDLIKAKKSNLVGVLNSKNEVIIPFKYQNIIFDFYEPNDFYRTGNLRLVVKENDKWSIIDLEGKKIKENIPEEIILKEYATYQITNYDFKYATICLIDKTKNYR